MCNTVEQARNGSQMIDELLKQKLLSVNYDKSKYLLLGNTKAKNRLRKELKKWPMKMGEEIIENSILEKYLGDMIHEKGCKESITATIKERMRKLTSQCKDIIVKTQRNSANALELDIVATCSPPPPHPTQTIQPLLDQLESCNLAQTLIALGFDN